MSDLFLRPLFTWRSAVASKHGPRSPTTRHVLLTLACYMSEKGDSCFPATRTLAEDTGLSHRAVLTHLEIAQHDGWIGRRERQLRNGKGWKRMEYFAIIPHEAKDAAAEKRGERPSPPQMVVNVLHHQVGGEPEADRGERSDAKVVKDVHLSTSRSTSKSTTTKNPRRPGEDYVPPESVRGWVRANGFEQYLQLHIEQFRDTCTTQQRKPYTVTGLDAAFRKCCREDWGKVRQQAQMAERRGESVAGVVSEQWWKTADGISAKAVELGVERQAGEPYPRFEARVFIAAGEGPWIDERNGTVYRFVQQIRAQQEAAV